MCEFIYLMFTDIDFIRTQNETIHNLLGHASSKTTEIYRHITTKGFDQIKSPLDKLENLKRKNLKLILVSLPLVKNEIFP